VSGTNTSGVDLTLDYTYYPYTFPTYYGGTYSFDDPYTQLDGTVNGNTWTGELTAPSGGLAFSCTFTKQ